MQLRTDHFPRRIRNTIMIAFMSSIVVMLSLFGWLIDYLTKQHLEAEMGKRLIAIAAMTAIDMPTWLIPQIDNRLQQSHAHELLRDKLVRAVGTGDVSRAYILNPQHQLIIDTSNTAPTSQYEYQLYNQELNQVARGHSTHTPLFRGGDGLRYKNGFVPLYHQQQLVGILGVQASADFFTDLTHMRRYLIYSVFWIAIIIIVISVVISERMIQPIVQLVQAAKRIGMGDLDTPVKVLRRNEFGLLAASIDEMRRDLLEKEIRMKAMLQGIAHEIRNPLGGIELFAGLLHEEIEPKNKNLLSSVKKIQEEVNHLKITVEQFLDFARDPVVQIESVSIKEVVEESMQGIQLAANEAKIKISAQMEDAAASLWLDKRLIKSALLNMLQNSLQAIQHDHGHIEIKTYAKQSQDAPGIVIEISDNGCGIAASELAHLFRPFYTTKEKGCGLGLAFSHKIIHSHSGTIEVESAPGEGTKILVWLPILLQ